MKYNRDLVDIMEEIEHGYIGELELDDDFCPYCNTPFSVEVCGGCGCEVLVCGCTATCSNPSCEFFYD